MGRLSLVDRPALAAAMTFAVIFAVCFFSLGSMSRFLAQRALEEQAYTMLRSFIEAYQSGRADLAALPALADLHCRSDGSSDLLDLRRFDNPYVRWFAVARDRQILCRSGVRNLDLKSHYDVLRVDDVWSLVVMSRHDSRDYVFLAQKREDTEYLALFEPLLFDFESSVDCRSCVSYELHFLDNPDIVETFGDRQTPTAARYTIQRTMGPFRVQFTLSATRTYMDKFGPSGLALAAGIATLVAVTLSFFVYWWIERQRSIANLIQQGIRRHEFIPFYQPIVDARDGSVLGAEALVRWHRNEELIPPAQFIAYAEESGLIEPITVQIVNRILRDLKTMGWVGSNLYASINVVPDQITEAGFCQMLVTRLKEEGIPGKNVAVEITERRKLHDLQEGKQRLACLETAGIDIKIDDAGTGFGGFSYVQELPVGTLKIDKMFIDTLRTEGDAKRPVLDAIIHFANTSGLRTIAEGVETRDQVDYLVRSGVYAIQGYVFAPPMPADQLANWIEARGAESKHREASHRA